MCTVIEHIQTLFIENKTKTINNNNKRQMIEEFKKRMYVWELKKSKKWKKRKKLRVKALQPPPSWLYLYIWINVWLKQVWCVCGCGSFKCMAPSSGQTFNSIVTFKMMEMKNYKKKKFPKMIIIKFPPIIFYLEERKMSHLLFG